MYPHEIAVETSVMGWPVCTFEELRSTQLFADLA